MGYYIGIDIGGTKTALLLVNEHQIDVATQTIRSETSHPELFFERLDEALTQLLTEASITRKDVVGIGVGMPGIIDAQQGIALYQNNLPLAHFPFKARLHTLFPHAMIRLDNDVNVAALHEYKTRQFSNELMLYITVSTGIAATIVLANKAVTGQGMAGEIGFSTLGYTQPLERDISGPALEHTLQQQLYTHDSLQHLLQVHDIAVDAAMTHVVTRLGQLVTEYLFLLHPHCIVIGGGVANAQPQLITRIRDYMAQQVQHMPIYEGHLPTIEQAIHQGDSGMRGALMLVL